MLTTAKNLALNHVAKWDNKYNDSLEEFNEPPIGLTTQNFEDEFESKESLLSLAKKTKTELKQILKSVLEYYKPI